MKKIGVNKRLPDEKDELIARQKERIDELREENRRLQAELSDCRSRETDVVKTLDFARKKGDEYVSTIRMRYALECDRIAAFREKLAKYRTKEGLIAAYDEAFRELKAWQEELEKAAAFDLGAPMKDFLSEKERLGDDETPAFLTRPQTPPYDLLHADRITDEDLNDLLDQL